MSDHIEVTATFRAEDANKIYTRWKKFLKSVKDADADTLIADYFVYGTETEEAPVAVKHWAGQGEPTPDEERMGADNG